MPKALLHAIALVSAATLAVQVLETRLFSVMLWHHLTYMVVTVTLLGFGAAGSLLALVPRLARIGGDARTAVSFCCSAFALSLVAVFAIVCHTPLNTLDIEEQRAKYFFLFLHYAYLVVPFLFAGLAVAIALSGFSTGVHRTYLWNLIGSAIGSVLFVLLVRPLGGPGMLFFCASLGGAGGLVALLGAERPVGAWLRVLAVLGTALWPASVILPGMTEVLVPIRPAPTKAQIVHESAYAALTALEKANDPLYPDPDPAQRRTIWTPLCRLDTMQMPIPGPAARRDREDPANAPRSQVHVFQDGDAPTVVWSAGHARKEVDYDAWMYGLGYRLVDKPRVLIIGSGGGNDIETALHYGATSVTAVEINGATLNLVRNELARYTNGVYEREKVTAVHSEGRSFLRRAGGTYDLLQMSGTDTYAALASGSYIFSESYLYTQEAMADYFSHLSERGVVVVIRPRFEPPRETLKLVATAARALRDFGVTDPRRHFIVVNHEDRQVLALAEWAKANPQNPNAVHLAAHLDRNYTQPTRFDVAMMRKTPFTDEEVARIEKALERMNPLNVRHWLGYAGGGKVPPENEYARLLSAMATGPDAEAQFHASYPFNTEPATDDRPFFFNFYSWLDVLRPRSTPGSDHTALVGGEPIGIYILVALLLQTALATVVLVLVPLFRIGFRAGGGGGLRARILLYFCALGFAYLLVEITTIQRFVLYLGHPTYSLTVGLASFLLFSGLGSGWAGRRGFGARAAITAATVVVLLLVAHALLLPAFLRATLAAAEGVRVLLTVVAIAPLAFAMGIPFPTGLSQLQNAATGVVPWAVGINGAASVVASVLSIMLAMEYGFAVVAMVAAGLYLLAAFTFPGPGDRLVGQRSP